ncbi:MAG: hypothetical protein MSIBF_03390 [Candidatus Altiarchaeales archaeon IMC4]|nr:MAG: hypothetical protein MSIBF_03390 [Candidatus Altiarchaeales archaeon IMC4]
MEENILRILIRQNPQWAKEKIVVPEVKRDLFYKIGKFMEPPQILAVTGLRRVGKTTIMKQLMSEVLKSSTRTENIMYASFDHRLMQSDKALEDIIEYFLSTKAEDGRKFLFLDEIQKVDGWEQILKVYYDLGGIKFIISGSASLQIKKAKESLSGRIMDFHLQPLNFREYLRFVGEDPKSDILEMPYEFDKLKKVHEENLLKKERIIGRFNDYLFKGAFPELVETEDEEFIAAYINNSVIEKIIYQDIPEVFKVKREDLLYSLVEYCAKETGKIFDITNLSNIFNADRNTVSKYLFYLENGFLIKIAYNYSRSLSKQMRKNKKIHVIHPSVSIALSGYKKSVLRAEDIAGYYVESLCNSLLSTAGKVFFFRDPQKREVDFVVVKGGEIIPIEVKYRRYINEKDIEGLRFFMEKFKCKSGIVLTKDTFKKEGSITYIPVWLFLLCVE